MPMEQHRPDDFFGLTDKIFQAKLARLTLGVSPAGVAEVVASWAAHLAMAPGKAASLLLYPALHARGCLNRLAGGQCPDTAADPRFRSESWKLWPWCLYAEGFRQCESYWSQATKGVPGVTAHTEQLVAFAARQILDAYCPTNFVGTNPDLTFETFRSGGANLVKGGLNALEDMRRAIIGTAPAGTEKFKVGENLAVTPGKVIYRNELIELIQYEPQTKTVAKEPVLIIPAWIMKYYILDLSPHNSLVNWLVGQGHTVFMISWKNPGKEDRNLGFDDYYRLGVMAALDAVSAVMPETKIHLTGYCLGGTLAMIAAAALAQNGEDRLKSLTLLAAQGDFTEAGELMLFVSESGVSYLKNMMWGQGYLDTRQMAGAFQMLRSYDLIWSKIIHDYLMGKREDMIDLMAWNADATRMPYRMHSEYLERLFLNNDFAEGRFAVEGEPVAAKDIQVPIFVVSTETDHVAPWRSVHKVHLMVNGPVRFVLTSGGHNAGIVNEPGHKNRAYRVHDRNPGDHYLGPDQWLQAAEKRDGSWWLAWQEWMESHSEASRASPPSMGEPRRGYPPLAEAPGTYVYQR